MGSAHQTRRSVLGDGGGGGGGKDTLEGAVMPSMLVVASMTVTEVTTRIGLVGGVALVALLLIGRMTAAGNVSVSTPRVVHHRFTHQAAEPSVALPQRWSARLLSSRSSSAVTRLASLCGVSVISGIALGVGLSLLLVALLNATMSAGS